MSLWCTREPINLAAPEEPFWRKNHLEIELTVRDHRESRQSLTSPVKTSGKPVLRVIHIPRIAGQSVPTIPSLAVGFEFLQPPYNEPMPTTSQAATFLFGCSAGVLVTIACCTGLPRVKAAAKTPELRFGSRVVRIGMSQPEAIRLLSQDYNVQDSGDNVNGARFWFVRINGELGDHIGSLRFKNNAVVGASRDWDRLEISNEGTSRFLRSIYAALAQSFSAPTVATVKCTAERQPDRDHVQIDIYLPGKGFSWL